MVNWKSKGKKYFYLKIANCIVLFFWIIFFFDGVSPTTKTVEVVRDFEEFQLHSFSHLARGSSLKKIITNARSFTTYANENGFFITDTLELKLTPYFGLVREYRQYPPSDSEKWIYHKLCSHNYPPLIITSLVLFLMTAYAIFFDPQIEKFKALCLFTIAGGFIFYLSLVT